MVHPFLVASRTIKDALQDKRAAQEFLANPAAVFRNNGLDIPVGHEAAFNSFLEDAAPDIMVALRTSDKGLLSVADCQMLIRGAGCTWCRIGSWSVAIAITAIGAAGLSTLTVASAPVVALAVLLGVSETAALAFIMGLAAAVEKGVDAVVLAICQWTGCC